MICTVFIILQIIIGSLAFVILLTYGLFQYKYNYLIEYNECLSLKLNDSNTTLKISRNKEIKISTTIAET